MATNRRVLLRRRPVGEPREEDFEVEERRSPSRDPARCCCARSTCRSTRTCAGRMSDAESYATPVELGEVMVGGTVGEVVESRNPAFARGRPRLGLRRLAGATRVSDGAGAAQARPGAGADLHRARRARHAGHDRVRRPARHRPAEAGRDGGGLGRRRARSARWSARSPRSRAAARRHRRRRGQVPTTWSRSSASTPASTTRPRPRRRRCKAACPDGIDVYFENVGGAVFEAVLRAAQPRRAHPAVRPDLRVQRDRAAAAGPNLRRCWSTAR